LISNRFAKAFAVDGMKAYTTLIQEKEMEEGCEVVKHQAVCPPASCGIRCYAYAFSLQWSGAEYADALLMTATGGVSSTKSSGSYNSETQFATKPSAKL
jgi:isocitrate lyase